MQKYNIRVQRTFALRLAKADLLAITRGRRHRRRGCFRHSGLRRGRRRGQGARGRGWRGGRRTLAAGRASPLVEVVAKALFTLRDRISQ